MITEQTLRQTSRCILNAKYIDDDSRALDFVYAQLKKIVMLKESNNRTTATMTDAPALLSDYATVPQTARRYELEIYNIRNWLNTKKIDALRIGCTDLIHLPTFENFLKRKERKNNDNN